jgi:hypothetical protein
VSALSSAAADTSFHEAAAREIPNALREQLSLPVFRQRFADFIGLDQSVLAPVPD